MHYSKLSELPNIKLLFSSGSSKPNSFEKVLISNMMSKVLLAEDDNFLLVTRLHTEQVLRTADIVNAGGVLITDIKDAPAGLLALAKDLEINLFSSSSSLPVVSDSLRDLAEIEIEIY